MSSKESIKENLSSLSREFEKKRKEQDAAFREEIEVSLKWFFNSIFDTFPTLEWFSWTQYTPYFNDWDTCEFSVHDINGIMFDWMEDYKKPYEYNEGSYVKEDTATHKKRDRLPLTDEDKKENEESFPWVDLETFKAVMEELKIISEIPEHTMEELFGEWEVIVTRGGIETNEYDHD